METYYPYDMSSSRLGGVRSLSFEEITGWLREEGLGEFTRVDVPPTRQTSIVIGVKPR